MKGSVFSLFFLSLSLWEYTKTRLAKTPTLGDQIRTRTQREWPRYRASRNVLDVYNNCRGHVRVKTNKQKQSGDKHDPGGIQMIGDKQNSEYSSIDFTCTQHAQSGRSSPAPPPSIFATRATLTSFGTLAFLCTSRLVSNKHTHPAVPRRVSSLLSIFIIAPLRWLLCAEWILASVGREMRVLFRRK